MAWHDVAGSEVRLGHFVCVFVDMVRSGSAIETQEARDVVGEQN
jgi:hypothetical protein